MRTVAARPRHACSRAVCRGAGCGCRIGARERGAFAYIRTYVPVRYRMQINTECRIENAEYITIARAADSGQCRAPRRACVLAARLGKSGVSVRTAVPGEVIMMGRSITALLLRSYLCCGGLASDSMDNGAVQRVVGITPTGGFTVNGEAFFPMGFYYLFEAIGGDNPAKGGHPPRTDNNTNASRWQTADDFWRDYYRTGFNTFTIGWEGSKREEGYGQMLDYLQQDLQTGILPSKCTLSRGVASRLHPCAWYHLTGMLVRRSPETKLLTWSWCCVAYAPCYITVPYYRTYSSQCWQYTRSIQRKAQRRPAGKGKRCRRHGSKLCQQLDPRILHLR